MSISAGSVRFDKDQSWVRRSDKQIVGVPLAWFPRLLGAEQAAVEITPFGLPWEALDEDLSVTARLAERGDQRGVGKVA